MAVGTSPFILRPRVYGIRRPGLEDAGVEDPRNLTNPREDIPCISTCGIPQNLIWNALISRDDGNPSGTTQQETTEDPESGNLTGKIVPSDSGGEEDLIDDEEEGSSVSSSDTGHPR
jgi:hypothetical protein